MNEKLQKGIDYTGIAVLFYCWDGKGKFLMTKRSTETRDEHGRWECGGGGLDFGESPEKALARELYEELSIEDFEVMELLPPQSSVRENNNEKTHWIVLPYIIKVSPDDVTINEPDMVDDHGWFQMSELPHPLHSSMERELEIFKPYFDKYQ